MPSINSNNSELQNPFEKDDSLQAYLENDPGYQSTKKQSLIAYLFYRKQQNFNKSRPFNNFVINIFKTFSTHSTAFVIGLVLAGSVISASASELLAPKDIKPSTLINKLFTSNKQADKDPYTALIPDMNNSVVILDECDLAVKYPKKVGDIDFNFRSSLSPERNGAADFGLAESDWQKYGARHSIGVSCYKGEFKLQIGGALAPISKGEMLAKTGWFIFGESTVTDILRNPEYSKAYFKFKEINYEISFIEQQKDGYNPAILGNEVQIQFASLAKNQPDTKATSQQIPARAKNEVPIIPSTKRPELDPKLNVPSLGLEPVNKSNFNFERCIRIKDPEYRKPQCLSENNETYQQRTDDPLTGIFLTTKANQGGFYKEKYDTFKKLVNDKNSFAINDLPVVFANGYYGPVAPSFPLLRKNNFEIGKDISSDYIVQFLAGNTVVIHIFGTYKDTDFLITQDTNLVLDINSQELRSDCANSIASDPSEESYETKFPRLEKICRDKYPLTKAELVQIDAIIAKIQAEYALKARV